MDRHIYTHVFKSDHDWETVMTCWQLQRAGVRVTPPVPLRVVVWGVVVAESIEGWINIGGTSGLLSQQVQARGSNGQTLRLEIGEEIFEYPERR